MKLVLDFSAIRKALFRNSRYISKLDCWHSRCVDTKHTLLIDRSKQRVIRNIPVRKFDSTHLADSWLVLLFFSRFDTEELLNVGNFEGQETSALVSQLNRTMKLPYESQFVPTILLNKTSLMNKTRLLLKNTDYV